jgi:hypothetical protein
MRLMAARSTRSLLRPGDPRWKRINHAQLVEDDARARGLSVAERLDRGSRLSRVAAELRRAAWEAQYGRPAT